MCKCKNCNDVGTVIVQGRANNMPSMDCPVCTEQDNEYLYLLKSKVTGRIVDVYENYTIANAHRRRKLPLQHTKLVKVKRKYIQDLV